MSKKSIKEQILMYFMTYCTIQTDVFKVLHKDSKYVSKVLCKLLDEGLLKEKCICGKNKAPTRYRTITVKGVDYVKKHYADKYKWLYCLPDPIPKFITTTVKNYDMFERKLRSISVAIMLEQAGINVYQGEMKTYYRGKSVNFFDMVYAAKKSFEYYNQSEKRTVSDNIFFQFNDITQYFNLKEEDIQQNKFHQHAGALVFKASSYFVYSAKNTGLWLKWDGVKRSLASCSYHMSKEIKSDEWNGIIGFGSALVFAGNKTSFVKTLKMLIQCVARYKNRHNDSGPFRMILLFPERYESILIIKKLINSQAGFKSNEKSRLEKINKNVTYPPHTNYFTYEENFEILYKGNPAMNGTYFNVIDILNFINEACSKKDRTFTVICHPWQQEYYEEIFPENVSYIHVDDNDIELLPETGKGREYPDDSNMSAI